MASVYRRPGRKTWTAFYRDKDGRQHCRSTGAYTKKLAQKIADEYEQAAREYRTLRQVTKVLDAMHELVRGSRGSHLSLTGHVAQWLAATRLEVSPATHSFYRISSGKLLRFLDARSMVPMTGITKADLVAYRAELAGELSASTTNHHLTLVKMLFKAAHRDGLIVDDPAEHIEPVKQEKDGAKRRAFTVPEIESLLTVADPNGDR
jgi:hypothetical protein